MVAWVDRQPQVRHVTDYRAVDVQIGGKPTMLVGTDVAEVLKTLPMKSLARAGAAFDPAHDALESEPLAGRTRVPAGGTITVDSPTGPHAFHVYGIFYDFGTERGQLMLDRPTYAADWRDDRITSLHVALLPGQDRNAVAKAWSRYLQPLYPVVCDSFDSIRVQAMTVFDARSASRSCSPGSAAASPSAGWPGRCCRWRWPAGGTTACCRGRHGRPPTCRVGAGAGAADRVGVGPSSPPWPGRCWATCWRT